MQLLYTSYDSMYQSFIDLLSAVYYHVTGSSTYEVVSPYPSSSLSSTALRELIDHCMQPKSNWASLQFESHDTDIFIHTPLLHEPGRSVTKFDTGTWITQLANCIPSQKEDLKPTFRVW